MPVDKDKDHPKDEPTQYTPQGYEIPVPTKEQVLRDLERVAKPRKPLRKRVRRPKEQ